MRSNKITAIAAVIFILVLSSVCAPGLNSIAASAAEDPTMEAGLYSGIVKENNPSLGYITLYFQDGSGLDPDALDRLVTQRTFTYGYDIPVLRDGRTVSTESILPGDQVFIKLDEEGYIAKLSAKSYYKAVYGTVHMRSLLSLVLKDEAGNFVNYPLKIDLPVYKNGQLGTILDIAAGDRIRLLVQTNNDFLDISFIEIEKQTKPVTGIYRARVEFYDTLRDSLSVSNVQEFVNGRWESSAAIGIQSFLFDSAYKTRPDRRFSGMVYFTTKKVTDGSNRIAVASYRSMPNYELTLRDNLLGLSGNNRIDLKNTSDLIGIDAKTLVIKNGRLVDISALSPMDPIQISMEKSLYSNDFIANVLISETATQNGPVIYRGRIKSVDPHKTVTVESFAQLNGVTWTFTNTPKTFDIDLSVSRLIESDGVGNIRELDSTAVGQSMYFVVEGTKIKLMSTAPYAESPVSGRIKALTGSTYDSSSMPANDPTGLVLTDALIYNTNDHQWNSANDITMAIPAHAVIIRKGTIGTTSLLKPGDEIQILRHAQTGEGIIVLCD